MNQGVAHEVDAAALPGLSYTTCRDTGPDNPNFGGHRQRSSLQ